MKTWIFVTFCVLLLSGCNSILEKDVSNEATFQSLLGKKYILLRDCYILRPNEPILPIMAPVEFGDSVGLPDRLNSTNIINKSYGNGKVMGVVRKGDVFEVIGVRNLVGPSEYVFVIRFEKANSNFGIIDAGSIQLFQKMPEFNTKYAKSL